MTLYEYIWDEEDEQASRSSVLHPGARTEPCPTCEDEEALTKEDIAAGYQCDICADLAESTLGG